MGFGQAIKSCFSQYATFTGRARRSEFWFFQLFYFLVQLPFMILFYVLFFAAFVPVLSQADADGVVPDSAWNDFDWGSIVLGGVLLMAVTLALLIPTYAVWARRLHDMGQSGHWLWLNLVSLGIVPLIMAFLDSQPSTNRWGPDPKAAERAVYGGYAYPPAGFPPPPQ